MREIFITTLVLFSLNASADQVAQSNSDAITNAPEPEGRYGAYIGCMNRVRPPIANGLTLNPNNWDEKGPGPDREPVLFFDSKKGGFYFVSNNVATFDIAINHKPKGNWDAFYPLEFKRSNGEVSIIHYVVRDGRPDSAGSTGNPEYVSKWRNAHPTAKYKQIGLPEARTEDAQAVQQAFADELIPRFATIKKNLEYERRDPRHSDVPRFMARAKEAFCVCAKTNRPDILRAIESAAKEIGVPEDEYKKCFETPVAWHSPLHWNIFPNAYAESVFPKLIAHFEKKGVQGIGLSGDAVITCVAGKGTRFEITNGEAQPTKCSTPSPADDCRRIGKDAQHCVKSGSRIAGVTNAGVVLLNIKSNQREVIPLEGVQKLALSESWLALADSNGVSVYKIK